jgi:Thioredoxin
MSIATRLLIVTTLVIAAGLIGAIWLILRGRVKRKRFVEHFDLAGIGLGSSVGDGSGMSLGESATLVLFSTEFCAICPGVERAYLELLATRPWAKLIKVDLTNRNDLAVRFHILQTPTTFVLDGRSAVAARIGGAPKLLAVETLLDELAVGASNAYSI